MTSVQQHARPTRVLVVDDYDLFRAGLAALLSDHPDIEVVAQASGGRMGVRLADELHPDVVLMDLRMEELSGIEATRLIVERHPDIRVLALTVATGEREVIAVLNAGAVGFLAKDTDIDSTVVAIRAAAAGSAWLSPTAAQIVLDRIRTTAVSTNEAEPGLIEQLSTREREVLRLIAVGQENAEIASELHISPRTVKNHVSSILAKLEVPSRVQAAVYAVRQGVT